MKRLDVIVSTEVRRQISDMVFYIARDSIDNALAWESRLLATLDALGDAHGYAVDESASERVGFTVRKVVFEKTYLIHYRVTAAAVEIVNVRHGARLPGKGEP